MKRSLAFTVLSLFVASGFVPAQDPQDPPRVRPPQIDPAQPPGGFPGGPPGGGPGFPPGFPGRADHKELVGILVEMIEDSDTDVRASVGQALAKIGRQSVAPLLAILKDKEKTAAARASAAHILGQIGPQAQEALPTLTKALKETDKDLRKRAASAIASIVADEYGGHAMPAYAGPGPIRIGAPPIPPRVIDPGSVGPEIKKPPEPEKKPDPDKK